MKKKRINKKKVPAYAFGIDEGLGVAAGVGSAMEGLGGETSALGITGGALGGAAKGAQAGMTFGPIGGAVGGALGLAGGLFKGIRQKKAIEEALRRKRNAENNAQGQAIAAELEQQYADDNASVYTFENGGVMPNLAYVDSNELLRDYNGNITQVPNSRPGTDNHLIDASQLDAVLSDHLKRPGTKNTFAKEGQILAKMTKPSKGKDKFAENTNRLNKYNANRAYNNLLMEQEEVKRSKGIKPKMKGVPAYEDGTDNRNMEQNRYVRGKIYDAAIATGDFINEGLESILFDYNPIYNTAKTLGGGIKSAADYIYKNFDPRLMTQAPGSFATASSIDPNTLPDATTAANLRGNAVDAGTRVSPETAYNLNIDPLKPGMQAAMSDAGYSPLQIGWIQQQRDNDRLGYGFRWHNAAPAAVANVPETNAQYSSTTTGQATAIPATGSKPVAKKATTVTPDLPELPEFDTQAEIDRVLANMDKRVYPEREIEEEEGTWVKPKAPDEPAKPYSSDWLSLAPTMYNFAQSLKKPEIESPVLNPYAGTINRNMARRRMNIEPTLATNRRSRAINRANMARLNPNTGMNIAAGNQAAASEYAQNANLYATRDNANNQYLAEYANMANNLGQQYVQNQVMTNDLNARNRARARDFGANAASQLGKWSQIRRQEKNQWDRDQMLMPYLKKFLSKGYDTDLVNSTIR